MQALPKWRCALILRNGLTSDLPSTQLSMFHSTPLSCGKWNPKSNARDTKRSHQGQDPTNFIRYTIREKQTDAKKALNNLLRGGGCFRASREIAEPSRKANKSRRVAKEPNDFSRFNDKVCSKATARSARREHYRNRKLRRERSYEDFEYEETVLKGAHQRRYTWSYKFQSYHFENPTSGFEWREEWGEEEPNRKSYSNKNRADSSDFESDKESCYIGLSSERKVLGLPSRGPLKLEEVKTAFRSSALKWHPDKHVGPSQAMAEEKFKVCANAYKSLCSALSPA